MGEIRAELWRKVGTRNHAQIDLVAELGEDARRRVTDPVSAGFIDPWSIADVLLDDARQLYQFFALEFKWQIAWIGVFVGFRFNKGRIIPGLQMGADFTGARTIKISYDRIGFRRATDRIIENIGRPYEISFKDALHL